ncbi:hypothetical protein P280DRAFT_524245 [Massarina eburnea CBS 473.64]|uniref:Uncharacterized protein n=1 Tax=Massarina eburnea CBS 473.64 TaxID=1395130 RepID=A0A6A6RGD8_9PLEO|nr:hypothetical protein P280DRAFT_524245 [Massarina eburnea CBS 473.64]
MPPKMTKRPDDHDYRPSDRHTARDNRAPNSRNNRGAFNTTGNSPTMTPLEYRSYRQPMEQFEYSHATMKPGLFASQLSYAKDGFVCRRDAELTPNNLPAPVFGTLGDGMTEVIHLPKALKIGKSSNGTGSILGFLMEGWVIWLLFDRNIDTLLASWKAANGKLITADDSDITHGKGKGKTKQTVAPVGLFTHYGTIDHGKPGRGVVSGNPVHRRWYTPLSKSRQGGKSWPRSRFRNLKDWNAHFDVLKQKWMDFQEAGYDIEDFGYSESDFDKRVVADAYPGRYEREAREEKEDQDEEEEDFDTDDEEP